MERQMQYFEDHIYSVLAAKLIARLKPEDIKLVLAYGEVANVRAPDWEAHNASLFSFLCLLSCNYIKIFNLDDTSPEYLAIIGNIAAVSGLFEEDDKPLTFQLVEKMMREGVIPINWEAKRRTDEDDRPAPRYLSMQRFLYLARFFDILRSRYEGEREGEQYEDSLEGVLDAAALAIHDLYQGIEDRRKWAKEKEATSKAPVVGRVDFEL